MSKRPKSTHKREMTAAAVSLREILARIEPYVPKIDREELPPERWVITETDRAISLNENDHRA